MRRMMFASLALAALSLSITFAQSPKEKDPAAATPATAAPAQQPAGQAGGAGMAAEGEVIVSKMRVQDYPAQQYFYWSTETTIAQIGNAVHERLPQMMQTMKENNVEITGPMTFVYKGATQDRDKPFTLEIGFHVAPNTKEAGDYKVRELPAFHCASVIYSGPIAQVGQAYQGLFTELFGAGLQPEGDTREMYLYWENPESPNNVQLIMQGVK